MIGALLLKQKWNNSPEQSSYDEATLWMSFLLWCFQLNICWGYFWQIMVSLQVAAAGETDIVLASKVFTFVNNFSKTETHWKSKSSTIQVTELGRRWSQLQNGLMRLQVIQSIIPVIIIDTAIKVRLKSSS